MSTLGHLADKPPLAMIRICPLWSNSRQKRCVAANNAKCQLRTFRPPFAMSAYHSIAEFSASLGNRPIFMKKVRCRVSYLTYQVAAPPIQYPQCELPYARLKGASNAVRIRFRPHSTSYYARRVSVISRTSHRQTRLSNQRA